MPNLRVAFLLSGSGTTLENLFAQRAAGRLPVEFVGVLASRPDAYGLVRAQGRGVPAAVVERRKFKRDEHTAFGEAVFEVLKRWKPDLLCFGGFMVFLPLPREWEHRAMNVHPALLPAFGGKGLYGYHVYEAVLAAGIKVTGCTVHFVDNQYDHGPIILQRAVEVREDETVETLAERVQAAEQELYPEAIRLYAAGRLRVEGRRVRILPG